MIIVTEYIMYMLVLKEQQQKKCINPPETGLATNHHILGTNSDPLQKQEVLLRIDPLIKPTCNNF